jgi:hypothetical protein
VQLPRREILERLKIFFFDWPLSIHGMSKQLIVSHFDTSSLDFQKGLCGAFDLIDQRLITYILQLDFFF